MRSKLLLLFFVLTSTFCYSQKVLQNKKFTMVTKDNAAGNQGAYASVTVEYMVSSLSKDEVYIATSVSSFAINAVQGYGYNGKVYRNEVPGLIRALEAARPSNPTVTFRVYYAGLMLATRTVSVTAVNNLNSFSGDGFSIPATAEQIKDPNWSLEAIELNSFSINPDYSTYTSIISKYEKMLADKNAYKKQIAIADKLLSSASTEAELLNAKAEFRKASALSPEESYPANKIESINDKITNLKQEQKRKDDEEKQKVEEEKKKREEEARKQKEEQENAKSENEQSEKKEVEKKAVKKEEKVLTESERESNNRRFSAAGKFEADGDELRFSNPTLAKQNYEQAQLLNYTNRVEQKIKGLKTNLQVEAGAEVLKGVGELADQIDPDGKTDFFISYVGYDGLVSDFTKLDSSYPSKPWNVHFFGMRKSLLFLALELRLGYYNSPYYKFDVVNNKDTNKVLDHLAVQQQAITIGSSAGLNFRIKRLCFYGLYGAEYAGLTTAKTLQENTRYSFNKDALSPNFPLFIFVLSTGIDYNIPKTRIGIGVRYSNYNVRVKPIGGYTKINGGEDSRYTYYLGKISPEKIQYSNFGVRFTWGWL